MPRSRTPELRRGANPRSAKGECELDFDEHRHRLTKAGAGAEPPAANRLHGFLIEAEGRIERADDLNLADAAVGQDDPLHHDDPLDLLAHRVTGVAPLHF